MTSYFQYDPHALDVLKSNDPTLGRIIDQLGHVNRKADDSIFESVIRHIIAQQISAQGVETIWNRLNKVCNGYIDLDHVACLSVDQLQQLGMTYRKARYIVDFVYDVSSGKINLDPLHIMDDQQAIDCLVKIKGIGSWTAQMVLLHGLNRMNILAYEDIAIHRGLRMVYQLPKIDKVQFEQFRQRFTPYGSLASIYLWKVAAGSICGLSDPARKGK